MTTLLHSEESLMPSSPNMGSWCGQEHPVLGRLRKSHQLLGTSHGCHASPSSFSSLKNVAGDPTEQDMPSLGAGVQVVLNSPAAL